jgi:hypothetical protein
MKQAAYAVQRSAWSKTTIPGLAARLAKAKQLSLMTMQGADADTARITTTLSAVAASTPVAVTTAAMPVPSTPTISRGLTIAALAALGAAGDDNEAVVLSLMNDPNAGFCMSMTKLNLNQCLSVARPYYEDVFCLGQHILTDIGQCVVKGAGQSITPPATIASGAVSTEGGAYAQAGRAAAAR